jgi:hypothetical protein
VGHNNLGFGYRALASSFNGCYNLAIGNCALSGAFGTFKCNIAIGHGAQTSIQSGTVDNVAVGVDALSGNTIGSRNIAIGNCSLNRADIKMCDVIAIGTNAAKCSCYQYGTPMVIAIGTDALCGDISGYAYGLIAIGHKTMVCCGVSRYNSIAIGHCSQLTSNQSQDNVSIGNQTLQNINYGGFNVAVGNYALKKASDGSFNTAVGHKALYNNEGGGDGYGAVWGQENTAIGAYGLYGNTLGNYNVAVGNHALRNNNIGNCNIAIGLCSLRCNTYGSCNVAIGTKALSKNSCGCFNTAIGYGAGLSNTLGCKNIFVGPYAGSAVTTGSNNTVIGYLPAAAGCQCTVLIGAGTCERLRVDNSGLYINNTALPIAANAPYTTATYVTPYTPVTNTNIRMIITGTLTVNAPSSGIDGDMVRMWITASGADRSVSINTSTIVIPDSSGFISPQTIKSGKKAKLDIQYDAVRDKWELATFVNGY